MLAHGRVHTYVTSTLLIVLALALSGCGGDAQAKKTAHLQRGDAYFVAENYAAAIIEFKNTLQIDPEDAHAHYQLALTYIKQGGLPNLQKAFQALKKSVDLDPTNLDAQLKLGEFFLLSKRFAIPPNEMPVLAEMIVTETPALWSRAAFSIEEPPSRTKRSSLGRRSRAVKMAEAPARPSLAYEFFLPEHRDARYT